MPRWNFDSIQPLVEAQLEETRSLMSTVPGLLERGEETSAHQAIHWLEEYVKTADRLSGLFSQLSSHAYCLYSIETGNPERTKALNNLEAMAMPLAGFETRFMNILKKICDDRNLPLDESAIPVLLKEADPESGLHQFTYFLERSLLSAKYRMSPEMEDLAADLQRSAGDAWGRLQSSMSSEMSTEWDPVTHERKTVVELRNLAYHPDRWVRKKAWALELRLWEENRIAFAAALNGVKGNSLSLYERRGYEDFLQPAILSSRISRKTLDALISAMEESLPLFRRYFKAKASLLGLPSLGFFDIFAPLKGSDRRYSYEEARDYIVESFSRFSPDLGNFARTAFEQGWIDAEPRAGKVGGAYMTDFPLVEECRIMSNFDGSFSALSTLAHELGHGYHSAKLAGFANINRDYPMTLAETASTFCETIIYNGALETAGGTEKLALIEGMLMENSQVIVDILSRFYFERELFARRKDGELSPEELCEIMTDAQKKTYGEGLNEQELHPYMWAVKGHYYATDLPFYNYPYAFGQLFALGLHAKYLQDRKGFPAVYQEILRNTGVKSAVQVCASAGFNIESTDFWRGGLSMLEPLVREFEKGAGL